MRIDTIFKTAALAMCLWGCASNDQKADNAAKDQPQKTETTAAAPVDTAALIKAKKENLARLKAANVRKEQIMRSLEMSSKYEMAVTPNSYGVNSDEPVEAPFTMVDFDSAGIRTRNLLSNPAAYQFIMDRMTKNKKDKPQYELSNLEDTRISFGGSTTPAYRAVMFHVGKARKLAKRENNTATNYQEIKIYQKYGNVVSMETGQATVDENSRNHFPARIQIKHGKSAQSIGFGTAIDAMNEYKKNYGVVIGSIKREEVSIVGGGGSESSAKYVVNMVKPQKKAAATTARPKSMTPAH